MRKSAGSRYVEANITIFETRFARSVGTLAKPVLLGWIVLSILWTSNPVAAQISPGSLSRAHQSISGMTECTTCHELSTGKPTFKCLDCHSEIARRIAARRGLHATYNIKPGSSLECTKCHSEHNGEDFPLVKWDLKTFDHAQTGYGLEGKHSGLECNRCHKPERVSPRERAVIKVKDLSRTFLGLSPSCSNCHQDEHKGQLGPNCLQCHNYSDWKTISFSTFDHSVTRYPLTGLHAQVACQQCHTPGQDKQPRYTGIAFGSCTDCHADPHRGGFSQTCQSCHSTAGWNKISAPALNRTFDHSQTKFPLLGRHAEVDCVQCHAGGDFKKPRGISEMLGLSPARSAWRAVCRACRRERVLVLPHRRWFQAVNVRIKGARGDRVSVARQACHPAVRPVSYSEGKRHAIQDEVPALHRLPPRRACRAVCRCAPLQHLRALPQPGALSAIHIQPAAAQRNTLRAEWKSRGGSVRRLS